MNEGSFGALGDANLPGAPMESKVSETRNHSSSRNTLALGWQAARKWIASERLRRLRSVLFQIYVLIALVAFALLAFVANQFPVFKPDVTITRELQEMPAWFQAVMVVVSWPGYGIESVTIIVLSTVLLLTIGLRWESASALFAGVVSGVLNYIVKIAVRRPRPGADLVNVFQTLKDYSFPSGHVMFYTAFFGFLMFLTFTLVKRGFLRYLLNSIFILLIGLVGLSRMYLGEHWASDVIAGYLLGSLTLMLAIAFYRWGKEVKQVPQPVAVTGAVEKPVPQDEKKELKETIDNPLLPKKEVKPEDKQAAHEPDNSNSHRTNRNP